MPGGEVMVTLVALELIATQPTNLDCGADVVTPGITAEVAAGPVPTLAEPSSGAEVETPA